MRNKEHRLGISEVTLVVRHLKLEQVDNKAVDAAIAEIDKIYGVDSVSFDQKHHILSVAYDASRICLDCIEDVLAEHKLEVSHDWWTHFKEGYYRYVDQNVKDNASHEPLSCHKMPPHR